MANRTYFWRLTLSAAFLTLATFSATPDLTYAQGYGNRPADVERNDRPDGGRRRGGQGGGRNRGPERNGGDNSRSTEAPSPATPAPTTATSSSSFGTSSNSGVDTERIRKWASDTIAKHDKSGDKILEGDELTGLGQSGRDADTDKDGKITVNELFEYSMSKAKGAASSSHSIPKTSAANPDVKPTSEIASKRKIVNKSRKSYRFKTMKERINSWKFSSKDSNGDGQVSMSEYSSSWSDRTASEFQRYDKDNDGMITVEEAK